MCDDYPRIENPARPGNKNYPTGACPHNFHCAAFICDLIREAIEAERARAAAAEAELWGACFGSAAPSSRAAQAKRIIQIASARALLVSLDSDPGAQVDAGTDS